MAIEVVNHTLMYNYPLNPRILYFVRFNYAQIDVEVLVIYFLDPLWEGDKRIVFFTHIRYKQCKKMHQKIIFSELRPKIP